MHTISKVRVRCFLKPENLAEGQGRMGISGKHHFVTDQQSTSAVIVNTGAL